MALTESNVSRKKGAAFLLEESAPEDIFAPEDLSAEHLAIAKAAEEFWLGEVEPQLDAIQHGETGAALRVLRKSAELGLTAIAIPERFGGLELDLVSVLLAAERLGRDGSYAAWHGAHTGIGTMPVLYFGTEEQKQRYLPKLASAEVIAAYALTEPQAGSDALAVRTRADLTPDGKHYILNGQKMWITNGGAADLFTVFAKVGGQAFTAFLVERQFGGITSGAEEKKMGIKGSSTTAIYFENVPVPVENVLGEVGRGHSIAFNILNIGRLKLGMVAAGGAKHVLGLSLKYAKQRKAFGMSIAEFGAIQEKLAEMTVRIFAAESTAWRVAGEIQAQLDSAAADSTHHSGEMLKAVEEYAVECSLVKVFGSEVLDFVVDEGVQIHGGYGFHQDYAVEKAYRDARINRIFEGTNEINRLLITGMLLKRMARGQLAILPAARALMKEIAAGTIGANNGDDETRLLANAKRILLLAIWLAEGRFGAELEKQQEVCMRIADIALDLFAMESTVLRARKAAPNPETFLKTQIATLLVREAMARIELAARDVLGACSPPEMIRMHMSVLRKLAAYDPVNGVEMRRSIAKRMLERERYFL